jgi:hypothetical protein
MRWNVKVYRLRLLGMLKEHGFACGPAPRTTNALVFVRPSHIDELFESIIVDSQGKRGEAVSGSVGVAVTRTVMYKLLGDVRLLEELAEDVGRGWTIIDDDSKAKRWEGRLVEVGPVKAKEWASARGPQLLQYTKDARVAARRYLSLLQPNKDLQQVVAALRNASSERIAEEAERLSACPMFGDCPTVGLAYAAASYLILCHADEAEARSFFGHDPMSDTGLLERIEIIADKLLQ